MSTKQRIATEVRQRGANVVAKELNVLSRTLLSYVAGCSNDGTEALIEKRDAERKAAASSK